jgi:hypothetical protein
VLSLSDTFYQLARERLVKYPHIEHEWLGPDAKGKRVLSIPKGDDNGFDIRLVCEMYGLYPYAGDWHGAPWDVNTPNTTLEKICEDCLGFIRSILSPDGMLTVIYAGKKPRKWILSYPFPWGASRVNDETGLLFFNYFAPRSKRVFQNRHLPARELDLHGIS